MKTIKLNLFSAAVVAIAGLSACSTEAPFDTEREGTVRLQLSVSAKTTRADNPQGEYSYTPDSLLANATIVIGRDNKALYYWNSDNPAPASVNLRYGSYVADVWSGDSLPASFSAKYFRASQPFEVNQPTAEVSVNCKIANVVASIDETTIDNTYVKDVRVSIANGNGKGSLEFSESNFADKGYYMLSSNPQYQYLDYTVTATNLSGEEFTKTGRIEDAVRGHEYRLKFTYNPNETTEGGANVQIEVDTTEIEESEDIVIKGAPQFSWFDEHPVTDQIVGTKGSFATQMLRVACWGEFKSLVMASDNAEILAQMPNQTIDFCAATAIDKIEEKGIRFKKAENPDPGQSKYFIYFTDTFLNALPENPNEMVFTVTATDDRGKETVCKVSIANTESAIVYPDPIVINGDFANADFTAVGAKSAVIPVQIVDSSVENPQIYYRVEGDSNWQKENVNLTRASVFVNVVLKNLTPGKTYEYKVVWGAGGENESKVSTFATESVFVIPNASMEEWQLGGKDNKVYIPSADGNVTFWDSGNHGSATMKKNITNQITTMFHTGTSAAELKSQFVGVGSIGKMAAGNIFVGSYDKTDGTNGELTFGRVYNGSHPQGLRLWTNYRPGTVTSKGKGDKLSEGATDIGQIYVALTTQPVSIKTKTAQLFEESADYVVAYGEFTMSEAFGPDGSLQELIIPLVYKDRAKTVKPTHLVVVCSASKYGDFFQGGEGSTLVVDDFELIYE